MEREVARSNALVLQSAGITNFASLQGAVDSSRFDAVLDAGERPEPAVRPADIFRWDLDFYADPQPGDTFRPVSLLV